MTNLRSDSSTCRRVVLAFLDFLDSVQPAPEVDLEAINIVKDCLRETFRLDASAKDEGIQPGMLVELLSSKGQAKSSEFNSVLGASTSGTTSISQQNEDSSHLKAKDPVEDPQLLDQDLKDQLMAKFFAALDRINYFRSPSSGLEDSAQISKATELFCDALKDVEHSQGLINLSNIAETLKSRGNKSMQAKLYSEAIELYTCAIAISDKNAVYYCNRAAAFTEIRKYSEAIQDCLKAIEIDPNYSKAYSRLGLAYYAQGNYIEALEKGFLKALRLDPNNDSVKMNIEAAQHKLAEQYRRHQEYQSAGSNHGQDSSAWSTSQSSFTSFPFNSVNPADIPNIFRTAQSERSNNGGASFTFDSSSPIDIASILRTVASHHHQSQESSRGNTEEPTNANNAGSHAAQASTTQTPGPTPAESTGPTNNTSAAPPPFNPPNPADFANIFRNMASGAQTSVNVDPVRVDVSFGEAPQEISEVVRSVMGMFVPHNGSQQNAPRGNDQR